MNVFFPQLAICLIVLLVLAEPLGAYMTGVFGDKPSRTYQLGPVEWLFYRVADISPKAKMGWKHYALAVIVVNVLDTLAVYTLQRTQQWLSFNSQGFGAVTPGSSFNTAVSFTTNTNWQGYSGESTVSYLTQMLGLTVQNFLSAAAGIAVVIALIRGFAHHSTNTIGNFWVDFTRPTVYVLLPLSIIVSIFFISQGIIQNFGSYKEITTVTATTYDSPEMDVSGRPIEDTQGDLVTEEATT